MHESAKCSTCRGLPIDGSITDEQFYAFLERCREELSDKQSQFLERIGEGEGWSYDGVNSTLTIDKLRFTTTAVGTYSAEFQTWLWAWANEDFPPAVREAASRIQGLYNVTGFRVFREPGIGASSMDAEDFTAMAVHLLGAIGLFRVPSAGPALFLAVHETHVTSET